MDDDAGGGAAARVPPREGPPQQLPREQLLRLAAASALNMQYAQAAWYADKLATLSGAADAPLRDDAVLAAARCLYDAREPARALSLLGAHGYLDAPTRFPNPARAPYAVRASGTAWSHSMRETVMDALPLPPPSIGGVVDPRAARAVHLAAMCHRATGAWDK